MAESHYIFHAAQYLPRYRVIYLVNGTGKRLFRDFDSPFLARQFIRKCQHSRKCRLVSWPHLD